MNNITEQLQTFLDEHLKSDEPNDIQEAERFTYKDNSFEIVSRVGYLTGVPQRFFSDNEPRLKMEIFCQLEQDKNARIIRHLCILRTAIEQNFSKIVKATASSMKSIFSLPEYVPPESIQQLATDGVTIPQKARTSLSKYVVEINRLISDRINNCKDIFPIWLDWQFIRELFIMPNGLDEKALKDAADIYYQNINVYPFRVYINWKPDKNDGFIFNNDRKFVEVLYRKHGKTLSDMGRVTDAGSYYKRNIYNFMDESRNLVMAVDCENADPYCLCATLQGLNPERRQKISKIILFDDIHAASGWDILEDFIDIPIEHIEIERIKGNKSLVDMRLAVRISQEHYTNDVDSFALVSSDSDYWALISSLPNAKFLLMV